MPFDATHEDQATLNMMRVRDFLKTLPPAKFSMGTWGTQDTGNPECDSPACIAGWTCFVIDGRVPITGEEIQQRAAELLGLDADEADLLFLPDLCMDEESETQLAVQVLDQRLATGVIDWGEDAE